MDVVWSDSIEQLAGRLFAAIEEERQDPLQPVCLVTNSRVMDAWVRHRFLYDWSRGPAAAQRVLANWHFLPLFEFVNDWLYQMAQPGARKRAARLHPCSIDVMRWKLYRFLSSDALTSGPYQPLRDYLGRHATPRRRFDLAGRLAKLLDDYQVYRPEMLARWNEGRRVDARGEPLPAALEWQFSLWAELRASDQVSYVSHFLDIAARLGQCRINDQYRAIHVFGISVMPPVYVHFFARLSRFVPVKMYLFNPSSQEWFDDRSEKRVFALQGRSKTDLYLATGNPLLSSLGMQSQACLREILDRTEGQIEEFFEPVSEDTLLHMIQADVRERRWVAQEAAAANADALPATAARPPDSGQAQADASARPRLAVPAGDDSIQIHICHSPARELEALLDRLLAWFAADPALQPRHIQAQVPNMAEYAPFIDAVFAAPNQRAPTAIPYVIADRKMAATNPTANAFLGLLRLALPDNRCRAPEVMDILESDAVRDAFNIAAAEIPALRQWVGESGIRWGLDADHRGRVVGVRFGEASWRQGLDRMLLGYAVGAGRDPLPVAPPGEAGTATEPLLPLDVVGGDAGDSLGRLLDFFGRLEDMVVEFRSPTSRAAWADRLARLLDAFFVTTNATYRDVAALRQAVEILDELLAAAGLADGNLPVEVIVRFLEQELEGAAAHADLFRNAVVFSALRPMNSAPRPIVCLLGMGDGAFPRPDHRPGFDLVALRALAGDPSRRNDDRNAFLEALMAARDKLYISYVGRSIEDNEEMPPSVVVSELKDYILAGFTLPPAATFFDGKRGLFLETLHHLQAFHPDYFREGAGLFSYSQSNLAAARGLLARDAEPRDSANTPALSAPGAGPAPDAAMVSLADLQRFFDNPAEWYYRRRLDARFGAREDVVLLDEELIEPGSLDVYALDVEALRALQELGPADAAALQAARDSLRLRLRSRQLLPVGRPGDELLAATWREINEFLEESVEVGGETISLRALLTAPRRRAPCRVQAGALQVDGRPELVVAGAADVHARARYTAPKPKDRLRAWLAHLLLGAQGLSIHTLLVGKGSFVLLSPIARADALKALAACARLYEHGQDRALPFAPATSYAYQAGLARDGNAENAMAAARKAWLSGPWRCGDDQDAYLRRAFGTNGPMAGPNADSFITFAEQVFGPLLAARSAKDNPSEPATGNSESAGKSNP
ncbi:MAG: exodeoxyribonuclease V subunit gamma [Verrucomicrobiota bacterium]|nr:exodeoxyribonuclease V subunit gamma [Verrucomicrobiota bacterium]